MDKILFSLLFFATFSLVAQTPQGIPYQAVARNTSGVPLSNQDIKIRFSIRDSILSGPIVYRETHATTTTALGLFSLNVGMGTPVTGTFTGINWGKNAKFLQVEMDPTGGNSFNDLGTQQMMSVPYAISATNWNPTNTGYGEVKLFNCDGNFQYVPCLPKISGTAPVTAVSATSAVSGGTITLDGGSVVSARGVCWSTSPNPTISLTTKTNNGGGTGNFISNVSGLAPNTLYYIRAYATNSAGTVYGNQVSFTTNVLLLPTLLTTAVTAITTNSAASGGTITNDGGGGTISARGICWSTNPNPTVGLSTKTANGNGPGNFSSSLSGLTPSTVYYVRAYATNEAGTSYGNQVQFTTIALVLPTLTTAVPSAISTASASCGGIINSDGGGAIIERGVCWSTSPNPTISLDSKTIDGSGVGTFSSNLFGLSPNTLYYVKAYATNSLGTSYGDQKSFSTYESLFTPGNGVSDVDGNGYQSIIIGHQEWMKENLKVEKYRNGNPIPKGLTDSQWASSSFGACAEYNNDIANYSTFGKLYNWFAVADPRGLCPVGWHIPTDHDWNVLVLQLDAFADTLQYVVSPIAGGKAKTTGIFEEGTGLWFSPNTGATNSSGLTFLPGGTRSWENGNFMSSLFSGIWWSSSQFESASAFERYVIASQSGFYRESVDKRLGCSVRCLKD
jgi:uncharacterized protein (TIGR02145 family)